MRTVSLFYGCDQGQRLHLTNRSCISLGEVYLKRELVPGDTQWRQWYHAHAAAMPCFMGESTVRGVEKGEGEGEAVTYEGASWAEESTTGKKEGAGSYGAEVGGKKGCVEGCWNA